MNTQAFLEQVQQIAGEEPAYREGGTGDDGTCDCIGLVMGALYRLGRREYPLHSSNYFARFQTDGLSAIAGEDSLLPGMIVYKARPGQARLHERYLPGGRYHTGDLLDYYHAGVVEQTQPLSIVHCTTGGGANGILRDSALGSWSHGGFVSGVERAQAETQSGESAFVTAPSGKTVNLRSRPSANGQVIARVPVGSAVSVLERAQGWAQIRFDGQTGYMMTQFLQKDWEARLQSLEARVAALEGVKNHE